MAERSGVLADQFEQAVNEFAGTIEGLSEAQWRTNCPNDGRTVGVIAHHVAWAIPVLIHAFREIADGGQPATNSGTQLAQMNALHAEEWKNLPQDETVALLRGNAEAAAAEVRQLSDAQLAVSGRFVTEIPDAWTVDEWIERVLIGHVHDHLGTIRAAL